MAEETRWLGVAEIQDLIRVLGNRQTGATPGYASTAPIAGSAATVLIVLWVLRDKEDMPHAPWAGDMLPSYLSSDLWGQPMEVKWLWRCGGSSVI